MASGNLEIDSKALEAAGNGNTENYVQPPPYSFDGQNPYNPPGGAYAYNQYASGKPPLDGTAPDFNQSYAPAVYPGAYPQGPAGYSSLPVAPGIVHDDAWLIREAPQHIIINRQKESFVKHIVMSCCVLWLCCWPLGLTAFILALMANSKSEGLDEHSAAEAHQLGVHSWRTSIAGIIIGVIFLTTFIIVRVAAGS